MSAAASGKLALLLRRDLLRLMGSRQAFVARAALVTVGALPFVALLAGGADPATLGSKARTTVGFMHGVLVFSAWLVAPALGASAIREEQDTGSLDLLRMAGFGETQVALSKVITAALLSVAVTLALLPLSALGRLLGGGEAEAGLAVLVAVACLTTYLSAAGVALGQVARTGLSAYLRVQGIAFFGLLVGTAAVHHLLASHAPLAAEWLLELSPATAPFRLAVADAVTPRALALALAGAAPSALLLVTGAGRAMRRVGREEQTTAVESLRRRLPLPTRRAGAFRGEPGAHPVPWREWNLGRQRFRWLLLPVGLLTGVQLLSELSRLSGDPVAEIFRGVVGSATATFSVAMSYLAVSLVAVGLFGPEKHRGAMLPLVLTPLGPRSIVRGKLAGALAWPALFTLPWLLHLAVEALAAGGAGVIGAIFACGSLLAAWALLACIGAACSARATSESRAVVLFAGAMLFLLIFPLGGWALFTVLLPPLTTVHDPGGWVGGHLFGFGMMSFGLALALFVTWVAFEMAVSGVRRSFDDPRERRWRVQLSTR